MTGVRAATHDGLWHAYCTSCAWYKRSLTKERAESAALKHSQVCK